MKSLILKNVVKKIKELDRKNKILRRKYLKGDQSKLFQEIENRFQTGQFDLETMHCFIDLVLISSHPDILKKYSLEDISIFLKELCKMYPDDIDLNLEYFYLLYNVMDQTENARKHLKSISSRTLKKINDAKAIIET